METSFTKTEEECTDEKAACPVLAAVFPTRPRDP